MTQVPELEPTHIDFAHEAYQPLMETDAPYAIFAPLVRREDSEGEVRDMSAEEVLTEMVDYVDGLKKDGELQHGNIIFIEPATLGDDVTIGKLIDTKAELVVLGRNEDFPLPGILLDIITSVAQVAAQSGFNRDNATLNANIRQEEKPNPAKNIHLDGTLGSGDTNITRLKALRFIYALGEGTIIYPKLKSEGEAHNLDYTTPTGVVKIKNPTDAEKAYSIRIASPTESEILTSDAQQVRPGYIVAFDPTQALWHQAPNSQRPILTINVHEIEKSSDDIEFDDTVSVYS